MRRSAFVPGVLFGIAALPGALTQCAPPTALTVEVYSELSCADGPSVLLFGAPSLAELPSQGPSSQATRCVDVGDGTTDRGSVVVVSSSGSEGQVAFAVATKRGAPDASGCLQNAQGCIVAKRQFTFLPRTPLTMRVDLRQSCLDVACTGDTTCARGACVPATVAPSACTTRCDEGEIAPPVLVGGLAIAASKSKSGVKVWGVGPFGLEGLGQFPTPTSSPTLAPFDSFAFGQGTMCGLRAARAECLGENAVGELGSGFTGASATFTKVLDLDKLPVTSVHGTVKTFCESFSTGTVRCWGASDYGQAGASTPTAFLPTSVVGVTTAVEVRAFREHVCARTTAGGLQCWGRNHLGQLGDGTTLTSLTARNVVGLPAGDPIVMVSASDTHTCAITKAGVPYCWGANDNGQIGNNSSGGTPVPVTKVNGINDAVAIASTPEGATCVARKGALAACWGNGPSGELGNGSSGKVTTPVDVSGVVDAVGIAAGSGHLCAVLADATVRCWGSNVSSQLGVPYSGVGPDIRKPVQVPNVP